MPTEQQLIETTKYLNSLEAELQEDEAGYFPVETTTRPYQQDIINKLNVSFSQESSQKILVKLATGAGKTYTALQFLKQSKFKKAYVIQHRDDPLRRQWEIEAEKLGVEIKVLSIQLLINAGGAEFALKNWFNLIQGFIPNPDEEILILDECHHYWDNLWAQTIDLYWRGPVLGLTATPFRYDSDFSFLDQYADIIEGPSKNWLIDNGFLVPSKLIDAGGFVVKGYGVSTASGAEEGDFIMKRTYETIKKNPHSQDYFRVYQGGVDMLENEFKHSNNTELRAIVFAMTIDHATEIVQMFNSRGINAHAVTSENRESRKEAFRWFKLGLIKVLVTVTVITEGIDLPPCNVILDLRPTNSYSLYLQKYGRGSRLFPHKEHVLILDSVGNNIRFGHPDDSIQIIPDSPIIPPPTIRCTECSGVSRKSSRHCEVCNTVLENPYLPPPKPRCIQCNREMPFHWKIDICSIDCTLQA